MLLECEEALKITPPFVVLRHTFHSPTWTRIKHEAQWTIQLLSMKSNFALSLQHCFPVWACLRSALTCTQLLHAPSMACKCHFSQTVPESRILICFFLLRCRDDVLKWSFKRKCWAAWEIRIFHFSRSSAVSQFSFISGGQNFLWKSLISDLWLTFFFLPLPYESRVLS